MFFEISSKLPWLKGQFLTGKILPSLNFFSLQYYFGTGQIYLVQNNLNQKSDLRWISDRKLIPTKLTYYIWLSYFYSIKIAKLYEISKLISVSILIGNPPLVFFSIKNQSKQKAMLRLCYKYLSGIIIYCLYSIRLPYSNFNNIPILQATEDYSNYTNFLFWGPILGEKIDGNRNPNKIDSLLHKCKVAWVFLQYYIEIFSSFIATYL